MTSHKSMSIFRSPNFLLNQFPSWHIASGKPLVRLDITSLSDMICKKFRESKA